MKTAFDRVVDRAKRIQGWIDSHEGQLLWLVLLLAFALRLMRLDAKSIWWDEGSSVWQAPMSLAEITLYQARDQHPPLYYWLLHFWYSLSGSLLFSLRLFSVSWGTIGVALAYVIARMLYGSRQVGLLAAFLLAISRFHITWSQEIKMYAMTSTLAMFAVAFLARIPYESRALRKRALGSPLPLSYVAPLKLRIGYVASSVLAIYSHYIALLGMAAQNLYVLWVAWHDWRKQRGGLRILASWIASQLVIISIAVPWFMAHATHSAIWEPSAPASPLAVVRMVATLLSLGISTHVERYTIPVVLVWLPLVMARWSRRESVLASRADRLLWILLLVPWALTYLLTLPIFGLGYEAKLAARFFILCQTPFCVLLASSMARLRRLRAWAPAFCIAMVMSLQVGSLSHYYRDRYREDEYTTLAETIQVYGRADEAILLMNDSEWPVFHYAYDGWLSTYHVPYRAEGGEALIAPYVAEAWEVHNGLWVVTSPQARTQDPAHVVDRWLEEQGALVLERQYGQRLLQLYRKTPRNLCVSTQDGYSPDHISNLYVGHQITLVGYDQALTEVHTGQRLRIRTLWRLATGVPLKVTTQLIDSRGGEVVAESEPDEIDPFGSSCSPLLAYTDLPIGQSIPGGRYDVYLHLESDAGRHLWLIHLSSVRVVQAVREREIDPQHDLRFRLGDSIELLGYDLDREAYFAEEQVKLTLYWRAIERIEDEHVVFTHILGETHNPDTGNPLWGQVDSMPVHGDYPTTSWAPGDVIVDPYLITINPNTPPGKYALEIGMYSPYSGERLLVHDRTGQASGNYVILGYIQVRKGR